MRWLPLTLGGAMIERIKTLLRKPRKMNAEAPRSHVERALVVNRSRTAVVKQEALSVAQIMEKR